MADHAIRCRYYSREDFLAAGCFDMRMAMETATSAQAPLLKAAWMKPGAFYSHVGGWEDEYAVAKACQKIVCDDWETVKHRTQTLSRMYKDGELTDDSLHANIGELVAGTKPGRESAEERIYFNAGSLAYVDIGIARAMEARARAAGAGSELTLQQQMIFEHPQLAEWVRLEHGFGLHVSPARSRQKSRHGYPDCGSDWSRKKPSMAFSTWAHRRLRQRAILARRSILPVFLGDSARKSGSVGATVLS